MPLPANEQCPCQGFPIPQWGSCQDQRCFEVSLSSPQSKQTFGDEQDRIQQPSTSQTTSKGSPPTSWKRAQYTPFHSYGIKRAENEHGDFDPTSTFPGGREPRLELCFQQEHCRKAAGIVPCGSIISPILSMLPPPASCHHLSARSHCSNTSRLIA